MYLHILLLLSSYFVGISYGKTEAEIKKMFYGLGVECTREHPVPMEELQAMSRHEFPDHKDAKCLMACVFKKAEWMDNKGMFDIEKAMELCKSDNPENVEKQDNAKKLFDVCKRVNEEPVTDGDSSCDRAYLLSKCLTENGRKLGFET